MYYKYLFPVQLRTGLPELAEEDKNIFFFREMQKRSLILRNGKKIHIFKTIYLNFFFPKTFFKKSIIWREYIFFKKMFYLSIYCFLF